MTHHRRALRCGAGLLWVMAVGCQSTLEDGYKPRPLNASAAQRRAFYVSPFTPEAAAAEQEHSGDSGKIRKPGSY